MAEGPRLAVEVLGPLRVLDANGRDVTPDGDLPRRLLALLVLRRGETVSTDTAIDALWPSRRPRDPLAALQTHVFRVRRALSDGVVASSRSGYQLDAARVDVDADAVVTALVEARSVRPTDPAAALQLLDDALARWRSGPPYAELADVDAARPELERLAEWRVRAIEERAATLIETGRATDAVADLSTLAAEHTLRERPHELLMAALAAAGRTPEALRVYDDFRRRLGDELGIEPSPVLAGHHRDLLQAEVVAVTAANFAPSARRLPVPLTSLIGRDDLVSTAVGLAAAHRLITMIGPAGVGKTRLMTEVGHRLAERHPDRPVVLCELAITNADGAIDAVAATLGIDRRPGAPTIDRLAVVIGAAPLVLLLDNCEHVLEPIADLLGRLLPSCANLIALLTSRERVRLPGEQLCPIPPLTLTEDGPAEQLFLERARAVRPGYDPGSSDRARISEIVRRLDGLPLAIELAAARLHTLEVSGVAEGLDRRFRLLAHGPRMSARHRSLGAAVSWSVDLLRDDLQRVFTDLSIFVGSFDAAAVAAVADLDLAAATDALDALAERSLVSRSAHGRYSLLETLRAFGAERLDADGRRDDVARRHAMHAADWIETANARLLESGSRALHEIDAAIPDLAAAFSWLIEAGEVAAAGRIVVALQDFGFLRLRPDVLSWADRAIAADPEGRSPVADLMWASGAVASWLRGDLQEAGRCADRAYETNRRRGVDPPAAVFESLGNQALFEGRLAEAVERYHQALAVSGATGAAITIAGTRVLALAYAGDSGARTAAEALLAQHGDGETPFAAFAWYCAGEAELNGDVHLAQQRFARSIELAERTGTSFVAGIAGTSSASIEARVGDPLVAAAQFRRLLDHWRRAGVWSTQWTTLRAIAALLARLGRAEAAAVLLGAIVTTEAGHRLFGDDEIAIAALGEQLGDELGADDYNAALRFGATLDGDAAVEHALRSL